MVHRRDPFNCEISNESMSDKSMTNSRAFSEGKTSPSVMDRLDSDQVLIKVLAKAARVFHFTLQP